MYCQISDIHGSTLNVLSGLESWCNFNIEELTEVMRQRGDKTLIDLVNKISIGYIDDSVESVLNKKLIDQNDPNYPVDVLHIFAQNALVRNHNDAMMQKLDSPMVSIDVIDQLPKGVTLSEEELVSLRARKPTDTGNLSSRLELKFGSRVLLIDNIDISDRLIDGQIGVVKYITSTAGKITKTYVSFDNNQAGVRATSHDDLSRRHKWVPTERTEASFNIRKKSFTIKRTQFPLTLSYAFTIYKVQGLSLQQVFICFDLYRQNSFMPGQMYVDLSRVTSLAGLFLIGNYTKAAFNVNNGAANEYDRLRAEQAVAFCQLSETVLPEKFVILLLKV